MLGALLLLLVGPKIALYFSIWLLGLGAWRAIDATGGRKFGCRRAIVGAGLIVAAVAGWVALVAIVGTPSLAFFGGQFNYDIQSIRIWLKYFAVGALFAMHLVGVAYLGTILPKPPLWLVGAMRWAAGASFTLYLVHEPIMFCLVALSPWPAGSPARLLFVVFGIIGLVLSLAEMGERRKRFWQRTISLIYDAFTLQFAPSRTGVRSAVSRDAKDRP